MDMSIVIFYPSNAVAPEAPKTSCFLYLNDGGVDFYSQRHFMCFVPSTV